MAGEPRVRVSPAASGPQFVIIPARALDDPRLDAPAKMVLMVLSRRAGRDGVCYPGIPRVARDSSLGERTVKRALQLLEETGWIERIRRGRGITSLTRLIYDRPASEILAETMDLGQVGDEETPGFDVPEDAAPDNAVENKTGHTGPSDAGEGASGATQAPPEGPHRPVERRAFNENYSSSSLRDASTGVVKGHADTEQPVPAADAPVPESRVGEKATPTADPRGRVGETAPPAASPAALRAPTRTAPAPAASLDDITARPSVGIADRFADPDHLAAYLAYRVWHRFPPALDAELRTLNKPTTGGQPVPWDVIGRQLLQLQANGAEFNARLFAGYCRSAMAVRAEGSAERPEGHPASRARPRAADRSTAARSAFLELADQAGDKAKERAS